MDRNTALKKLTDLRESFDTEQAHSEADGVLCELLRALGYGDVVDAWAKIEKWYA